MSFSSIFRNQILYAHLKIVEKSIPAVYSICIASSKMSLARDLESDNSIPGPGLLKIIEGDQTRIKRIKFLAELFESHKYELRIAGGAVRDLLNGTRPQDIDFATNAKPEQSLDILKKHENILRLIVTAAGKKHGTVAVKFKSLGSDPKRIKLEHNPGGDPKPGCSEGLIAGGSSSSGSGSGSNNKTKIDNNDIDTILDKPEYDDESPFEITTLRTDKFTDGRHAEVEFINDWRLDAERRDLTINAMFLTLKDGQLVDYFNGESDLKKGIVRFVGDADKRIKEDYLRILRFFRFWSRYGTRNDPHQETLDTIQKNLYGLNGISGERLWQEVKKIMGQPTCMDVTKLMLKLKVFTYLGVADEASLRDYDNYVNETIAELWKVEDNVRSYLAASEGPKAWPEAAERHKKFKELIPVILFAPVVKTEDMCLSAHKRMKFSNLERDTILFLIKQRKETKTCWHMLKSQLAMLPSSEHTGAIIKYMAYLISTGKPACLDWKVPEFPLTGQLVLEEVKKRKLPAKIIKTVIQDLKQEWVDENFKMTKKELVERMNSKLDRMK